MAKILVVDDSSLSRRVSRRILEAAGHAVADVLFGTICLLVELGDVIVGPALTVKALALLPTPPSPLLTVTVRAPVAALLLIETFAVSCVALTNETELTVMPAPEKEAASPVPFTKPLPLTVMSWFVAP